MSSGFQPEITLERVWGEIQDAYDTAFIEELLTLPNARVYVFGGPLRDMLIGKKWKDLDLRVVHPGPKEERNPLVEEVFAKHGKIILKLSFSDGECFVLRGRFPGKKQIVADVQVVDSLEATPGDFTVSSLFMDLATGELHQQSPVGFEDIQKGIVRPMASERVFEVESSYIVLRALKLACQTGFKLDPAFEQLIRARPEKVTEHIEQDMAYIQEHGKDSFAETKLGNLFSGLKSDPKRYVSLINELGLFPSLCRGFVSIVPNPKPIVTTTTFDIRKFREAFPLEKKISLFLSEISRTVSDTPEDCFGAIKKALALDSKRADGNEFVVDTEKISYIS